MNISIQKGPLLEMHADLLVIGVFDTEIGNAMLKTLGEATHGRLQKIINAKQFTGAMGQSLLIPAPETIQADYVMFQGLGARTQFRNETVREISGNAISQAQQLGLRSIAIELVGEDVEGFEAKLTVQAMAEALLLAQYSFTMYREEKKKKTPIEEVVIIAHDSRVVRVGRPSILRAQLFVEGTVIARDLVNTPAHDMTPTHLAESARQIAKMGGSGFHIRVLDKNQCAKKGMRAFLAVAKGSVEPPQFIHLSYTPKKPTKKRLVVVGKGITFDSGGLSLKPSDHMETMKCDMAGAAAVLGLFAILGKWKPQIEVHGIIAATENMPSGHAIRPGDIVRASNKKTIEILNTDAEGRLTLADALVYAQKLEPTTLVDLATLTGACVVALGEEIGGVMSNRSKLAGHVLTASSRAGEKMWELPLESRYKNLIESEIADLKNSTKSRYGGALTAGLFLEQFVSEDTSWAHLDIAGPAFAERPLTSWVGKGGTGFGVRTLAELISLL